MPINAISEFFLPLFDFISDILNGVRLILDCHPTFGMVTIGLTFAPMAVLLPYLGKLYNLWEDFFWGWRKALLPLVYPLAVILATPSYVLYISFVALMKIIDPTHKTQDAWNGANFKGQLPGFLKFSEISMESETQLVLGNNSYKEKK